MAIGLGWTTGVACAAWLAALHATFQGIEPDCLRQLLSEGPPAWKRAADSCGSFDTKYSVHRRYDSTQNGQKTAQQAAWLVEVSYRSADSALLIQRRDAGATRYHLRVLNPRYRFMTGRAGPNDAFQLYEAVSHEAAAATTVAEDSFLFLCQASYRLVGFPLGELVASPEFEVLAARYLGHTSDINRQVYVRLRYTGSREVVWPRMSPGAIYWAKLDPSNGWLITLGGANFPKSQMSQAFAMTYGRSVAPVPARFEYDVDTPTGRQADVYEFAPATTPSTRPVEEFYLPSYGIPEEVLNPVTAKRPVPRSWVVGGSLTVMSIAGLVLFWSYRRRRASLDRPLQLPGGVTPVDASGR